MSKVFVPFLDSPTYSMYCEHNPLVHALHGRAGYEIGKPNPRPM